MDDSELISPALLELFRGVADPDRESIHFLNPHQTDKKRRFTDLAFAITDYGCYWLSYGKKTKMKIDSFFRWFDAIVINLSSDSTISFTFANSVKGDQSECTYRGRFAPRIHHMLRDHLRRISHPLSLPEFQERSVKITLLPDPSLYDPVLRYVLISLSDNDRVAEDPRSSKEAVKKARKSRFPSDGSIATFRDFVNSKSSKFPFKLIPSDSKFLLECLCLVPHVKTVVIASGLKDRDKGVLVNWLTTQTCIRRLQFVRGPPELQAIQTAFRERNAKGDNPVVSICCSDVPLDGRHFAVLPGMIDGQITQLNFSRSLKGDLPKVFIEMLHRTNCNQVTHLNVDHSPGMDAPALLAFFPGLQVLSMAACGLDVAQFFEVLNGRAAQPGVATLAALDISENVNKGQIRPGFGIPAGLTSIVADGIAWDPENLINFWVGVAKEPVRLSLSGAKLSDADWERFFGALADMSADRLVGLIWNGNPVRPTLFEFLTRCPQLDALHFVGSLKAADPSLPLFAQLLTGSLTLREVNFSGQGLSTNVLTLSELTFLFTAVQANRSLTRVICCNHLAEPALLLFVSEVLMANRRVTSLRLDSNNFYDYLIFDAVFRLWQDRGIPLAYPWPKTELDVICARSPSLAGNLPRLRALHDVVVKGNPAAPIPPETVLGGDGPAISPPGSRASIAPVSRAGTPPPFPKITPPPFSMQQSTPPPFQLQTGPPPRPESIADIPAIYQVGPRLPADRTLEFTDVDPINLTEDAEYLLPVPPIPALINDFVSDLFDTEFDLEEVMRAVHQA